ncbi:hypothetical protein KUTeg_003571 [Tegillarca granosa]|uniref:Uncharacterized protein n=1 Tax=Tegillarca granosa TaxID=220873 RepID=A0ABQ9FRY6_TEGGR|nr:hypothetical protein KUTeg_003571 [Tegillarca granosa]
MAEQEAQVEVGDDHEEVDLGYKVPEKKSLGEILNTDQEDESLRKYKEQLLGAADNLHATPFPDNPKQLKDTPFVMKEGTQYRIRISFYVQRDIVTGLKYVQKVYRKGIKVPGDKPMMVGSYGPKMEVQEYLSQPEEAPSGMIGRGEYIIESLFTDDDKNEHLKWKWALKVSKDWKD